MPTCGHGPCTYPRARFKARGGGGIGGHRHDLKQVKCTRQRQGLRWLSKRIRSKELILAPFLAAWADVGAFPRHLGAHLRLHALHIGLQRTDVCSR
jgi:hypothetical protein